MKENKLKVLCILPTLGQPRHVKRINMLQETRCLIEVLSFERDYHIGRLPNCNIEMLGKIKHEHYKQRIFTLLKAIPKVRRAMCRNNLVYAFGTDNAFMAIIAGIGLKVPVFMETGDLFAIQVAKGLKGRIYRSLEKLLLQKVRFLVTVNHSILDIYYRQWVKSNIPGIVIENKLEATFVENFVSKKIKKSSLGKPLIDRPLKIGFFGVLGDNWSFEVLKKLAEMYPDDFEIVVAGRLIGSVKMPEQTHNYTYKGEYLSPKDLPSLYNSVDVIWASYPLSKANPILGKWAKTNRFYEACCFGKPIITLSGGIDAIEVEKFKIGMLINDNKINSVVEQIKKIKSEDFYKWKKNIEQLPIEIYTHTNEAQNLKNEIDKICGI